ncbi:uncharacterized protein LOC117333446 [Pecten maximus]|uniref:uncharacterized protein LOC117333446 n=1 Tax=Pecten maximus TaxID=6579 RepID=UPI00145875CD|nr:uncharacterized protein LOC117333446 [Pecten maximus]XP_033748633.1 uncharacterized protein LOC117333446 [Pecten maximus]
MRPRHCTIMTISVSFNIVLIGYIYFSTRKTTINRDDGSRIMAASLGIQKSQTDLSHPKFLMGLRSVISPPTHPVTEANTQVTNIDNENQNTPLVKCLTPTKSQNQKQSVYSWNGLTWKENKTVCANLPKFRKGTLRTSSGDTPIFVHEPGVDKYISHHILVSGTWEREVAVAVVAFLQADKNLQFVDIGANIGVISLEVAKLGRRVVSVEPLIDNIQRLCSSVDAGHFSNDVTMVFNAISDTHEQVSLGRDQDNVGGTFVLNNNPNKRNGSDVKLIGQYRELVQTILLNDLLSLLSSDPLTKVVIKLDVEGYEDHVLNGADEFFRQVDVQTVVMEWTYSKVPGTAETIQSFMSRHSMYPYDFNHWPLELTPRAIWPPNVAWIKQSRNP